MKCFLLILMFPCFHLAQTLNRIDSVHKSFRAYGTGAAITSNEIYYISGTFGSYSTTGKDSVSNGGYIQKIQHPGELLWEKYFYSVFKVSLSNIVVDSKGNFYIALYAPGGIRIENSLYAGEYVVYILKYNPNGTLSWIRTRQNSSGPLTTFIDLNDNLYVSCSSNDGGVIKFDSSGNELVVCPVTGGRAISTDANGNIYCIEKKYSLSTPAGKNMLKKFTRNGILLWTIQFPADVHMTCDLAGNVYLIEFAMFGNAPITKLNGEGQLLWKKSTSLSAGGQLRMTLNETGNLYATGLQRENGSILACFDQTGATTWTLAVPYRYEPSQIEIKDNDLLVAATKEGVQKKIAYVLHFTVPGSPLTDIQELKNTIFTVFPNPSPQVFTISYCGTSTEPAELLLYDLTGKCALRKTSQAGEFKETLDLRYFTKGIYLLELVHGQEKQCRKLVLE